MTDNETTCQCQYCLVLSLLYSRFGMLSMDALRASRLVVDTGLHAFGWTPEKAVNFMLAHTAASKRTCEVCSSASLTSLFLYLLRWEYWKVQFSLISNMIYCMVPPGTSGSHLVNASHHFGIPSNPSPFHPFKDSITIYPWETQYKSQFVSICRLGLSYPVLILAMGVMWSFTLKEEGIDFSVSI